MWGRSVTACEDLLRTTGQRGADRAAASEAPGTVEGDAPEAPAVQIAERLELPSERGLRMFGPQRGLPACQDATEVYSGASSSPNCIWA